MEEIKEVLEEIGKEMRNWKKEWSVWKAGMKQEMVKIKKEIRKTQVCSNRWIRKGRGYGVINKAIY